MWTNLFSDEAVKCQLEKELGSCNGFNLLREMDLVASEDEGQDTESDMEEDDRQACLNTSSKGSRVTNQWRQ